MKNLYSAIFSGLSSALAIGILTFLDSNQSNYLLIMAPFGATAVLVFGVPASPLAQPKNVIFGHLITAIVGLTFISFVGVIPPGLLNMTAAKISLKEGSHHGILFSIGVCITVCVQTYLAAIFAKYLSNHPEVIDILQRVAFVIFVLITIYHSILVHMFGS